MVAAAYADGFVRLWSAADGLLLLELPAGHKAGESVAALTVSADDSRLVTADTAGYIKVWDLSGFTGMRVPKGEVDRAVRELAHWRAHGAAVSALDWIDKDGGLLLSASADGNVSLWAQDGGYVGDFGRDEWQVGDPSSYRNAEPQTLSVAADNDRPLSAARVVERPATYTVSAKVPRSLIFTLLINRSSIFPSSEHA